MAESCDFSLYRSEDSTKSGWDALYQAVESILRVGITTSFFDPKFGGDLDENLFKNIDSHLAFILEQQIISSLSRNDSRIRSVDVSIVKDEDNATVYMDIVIYVDGMGAGPKRRYNLVQT